MTQPTPLPASTVVLIRRDRHERFEIYLNLRPDGMSSYAGTYVFPGGRLEHSDYSNRMLELTRGLTPLEAQTRLGAALAPEICLGHWVAAVREVFEESGVHFFTGLDGPAPGDVDRRLATRRGALQRGEIGLADLLISEKLYCDVARLRYFFHRITPEHYSVRFDTRFYLAALPPGQSPLEASEEVADSLWITPAAALTRAEAGEYRMMPPTLAVLRHLSGFRSWANLSRAFDLDG